MKQRRPQILRKAGFYVSLAPFLVFSFGNTNFTTKALQSVVREVRADYGKENKIFTRARSQAADKLISGKQLNVIEPNLLSAAALGYLTVKAGFHFEALTRAGRQTFAEFSSAMRAEADAAKINLSDADAQKLYKEAANEYLTKTRETLSKPAQAEFDRVRTKFGSDEKFLQNLSANGDAAKMFESIAAKKANAPQREIELQTKLDVARRHLDRPEFIGRKSVQTAIAKNRADDISGYIGVELAKQKLSIEYPTAKGYQIQESVLLYKESGYKTIAEWQAAHPGKSSEGVIEMDGKAWQKETDADLLVVKKNAAGKYEIAHVEQIKAGKQAASEAKKQLDVTTAALSKISVGDGSVRIVDKRANRADNITDKYDLTNFAKAKAVTRGTDDKPNYDAKIGLTRIQIRQLADEIIAKRRSKGGN